jgi:hypothetical protein
MSNRYYVGMNTYELYAITHILYGKAGFRYYFCASVPPITSEHTANYHEIWQEHHAKKDQPTIKVYICTSHQQRLRI